MCVHTLASECVLTSSIDYRFGAKKKLATNERKIQRKKKVKASKICAIAEGNIETRFVAYDRSSITNLIF